MQSYVKEYIWLKNVVATVKPQLFVLSLIWRHQTYLCTNIFF